MKEAVAKKILNKVKENYAVIAPHFSQTRQRFWNEMRDFAESMAPGDRVLDLGCGNGRLYEALKEKSIDYTGVDNSPELLEFAKKRWGENGSRKFLLGDVTNLDWWKGEKYDVVFLIATLHHIPSEDLRKKVLENVGKVLAPNGFLIMTNWALFRKKYLAFLTKNIFLKLFRKSDLDFGDAAVPWKSNEGGEVLAERYVHAFTLRELKRLVKGAGLEVLENFYIKKGKKAHSWNGWNIVTIAKK
ncbi:MAG: methyltransferase domain-containing protein [Patescibacteria group bacterium]|jgi:ubiquinone/menaquinone biosynthesis C-methylase UbiE